MVSEAGQKMITAITIRLTDDQLAQLKGKKGQPAEGKATPWLSMTRAAATGKTKGMILAHVYPEQGIMRVFVEGKK